jgi:hypothetical protein
MQLRQGFRQTLPSAEVCAHHDGAVHSAWVGGLELRNAQRKKSCSPKSVVDFTDFR